MRVGSEIDLSTATHSHDFHQIIYLFAGHYRAQVDSLDFQVRSGHLLVIGPSQVHALRFPPRNETECDVFQIKCRINPDAGLGLDAGLIDCSPQRREVEAAIGLAMRAMQLRPSIDADAAIGGQLAFIAALAAGLRGVGAPALDARLRLATDHILANLDAPVSVTHLAHLCGLDPSYFCRLFRTALGLPPRDWIIARRMERARDLLLFTSATLAEIAETVGCCSYQHFSGLFLKVHGLRPSEFRAQQAGRLPGIG
jgi:AraC-like DNA-binding protein